VLRQGRARGCTNPAFQRVAPACPANGCWLPRGHAGIRLRALCAEARPGSPVWTAASKRVVRRCGSRCSDRSWATVLEVVGASGEAPSVRRLLYLRDITHESEVDRMKSRS